MSNDTMVLVNTFTRTFSAILKREKFCSYPDTNRGAVLFKTRQAEGNWRSIRARTRGCRYGWKVA